MTEEKEREFEIDYPDDAIEEDTDGIQTPLNLAASRIAIRRAKSDTRSKRNAKDITR